MASQLGELGQLCAELRSEKPATRNKAADRLEVVLTTSKSELLAFFGNRRAADGGITWANLFDSAVDAALKHAAKVEESSEAKSIQTMLNKNHIFRAIVSKLIEYNLESNSSLLCKATIYAAVIVGFSTRSAIKIFGSLFMEVLERGLYKSPLYVRELKFSEYSTILSNLFEMNIYNNDVLRFEVLHCILKTIEIAVEHVQISTELVDYLPEVAVFARKASDDRRKAEAIKLYYLFVSLLSVDYHQAICNAAQDILPTLCDSVHYHLRADAKQTFFHAVYLSLRAVYPSIGAGDFGTINITLKDSWPKTLRKLKALMDLEIKERKLSLQTRGRGANDKSTDHFIKMAGVLVYLMYWHVEANSGGADIETEEPRQKVPRVLDKLETVLGFVQLDETKFNDIWLFILSELICQHETIINSNNYQPLLHTAVSILRIHANAANLCQLRHIFTAILRKEKSLTAAKCLPADCCAESWRKVVTFLISESSASNEIIAEKQLLLQQLIAHGKLTADNCNALLQSFISNSMLRRSECFETVRSILTHVEQCGFDKTSQAAERFITWACETTQSINAKSALLNITPIDTELMADTCAIAVINFLEAQDTSARHDSSVKMRPEAHYLQMLQYKYNRKFVCVEAHGREMQAAEREAPFVVEADNVHKQDMFQCGNELSLAVGAEGARKNCLFQCSYELLMRALNVEISKELTCSSILLDLSVLYKLTTLMRAFLRYGVFDEHNFRQCPLIKRIGFFLSHMESQLKNNNPRSIERSELLEILQHLEAVFGTFMSNSILLHYLETQPLEELISFLGNSLKHNGGQQCNDADDDDSATFVCLRTLAQLCASNNYQTEALAHITQHRFNVKTDLNILLPLIKIFCTHKATHGNDNASIANWFVEKLKLIFRLHHSNVDIIDRITEMLPAIFNYVQCYENLLNDMFVALLSLLKIAYKKSYSVRLTSKMLNSVRLIARQCSGIYRDKDFVNICLSAAKFLPFPSLEIQFAVINTVAALMDAKWLKRDILASDTHFEFCNDLCELLDYKSLSDITPDLEQNRNSVSIQMLVALLGFSSYYQESALQELSVFCALKKITEAELKDLQQIAIYHKCSLEELTKPYMNNLIHFWISKKYPILKYPYFLCYKNKHDFVQQNLATIATCQLLYTTNDDLKKLNKYETVDKLVELALPALHAFLLPHEAKCSLAETADYKYYFTTLTNNLQQLGVDLPRSKADLKDVHWDTIYHSICLLRDNQAAKQLLGFPAFNQPPQWFDLTHQQLQCCLSCYARSSAVKQPFHALINDNALSLLHTLNALKKDIYICRFPNDSVSRLCKYCAAADLLIDSMSAQQHTAKSALHTVRFFLRDTILFLLQYLQSVHQYELQKAALTFLQRILNKSILLHARCCDIIEKHLNDISKCLVMVAEQADAAGNGQLALTLLQQLLSQNEAQLSKTIALLDEFPASEQFSELRAMQCALQSHSSGSRDLACQVRKFLEMDNCGVKGLNGIRQFISTNRSALQTLESSLFHGLVEWLLRIVRSAGSMHICLEAAKCLGEIGSMRIEGISYFFGLCCSLYYDKSDSTFIERMMAVLDELLLTFDVKTYQAVCDIACLLVKTKVGADALSDNNFHYLTIFRTPPSAGTAKPRWSPNINANAIDWLAILKSTAKLEWSAWIRTFMAKVFECCGWQSFRELAQTSTAFAESAVFPIIKQLLASKEAHLSDLVAMLEYFFGEVVKSLSAAAAKLVGREIYSDKRAIRMFLNFCESIRIDNEWNVPVNLLHVAKSSNYCQAYFVSIMYLELWAKAEQIKPDAKSNNTIIGNATFQEVAIEAYQSIGCCDAIAGFVNPLQSRVNFLDLNNDWADMLLENSSAMWDDVCTSVLKRNGMLQLAHRHNQRPNATDYEILWRLGQWDGLVEGHSKVNTLNDMEHEYEKHHYNALKCLYNREEQNCLAAVRNARHCVLSILKEISIECLPSMYKYLTWLQLLQQAEDFCKVQFVSDTPVEAIFNKWQAELDLEYGNFQCKELILAHQSTLFRTAGVRASRKIKEFYQCDPVEMCLLKSVKECKAAGEINLAKRDIATLRNVELSSEQVKLSVLLEDAEVCFRTDKLDLTQAILKHVLKQKELSNCLQTVRAVRLYGEYLMESQTQTFENVLDTMFKLALQMLDKFAKLNAAKQLNFEHVDGGTFAGFDKENRKSIYQTIAKYADREYTQLQEYVNSIEFHLKCRIMKENREAAESIGKQSRDRDKNCGAVFMRKFANLDEAEVKLIKEKRTANLCIAVENYIKLCQIDEGPSSAAIYRIIALWFANKQNETFHSKIKDILGGVPSYKFICALNQMTARLNSKHEHFVELLKELLVRCLQDHPHHTLYHLFALVFAFNDGTSDKSNDRTSIAKEIIQKGRNKANADTIKQMQIMLPALIEFANAEATGKNITIPLADKLKRLKRLDAVHCPTVELPVAANQVYNIISIENWQDEVSLVGGINAPKKLSCACSDGRSRPQLLKGKDDLRQDAVMQQVFSMMNGLLRSDPKAVERKLGIRTYKVVPLSMRSGILEWCSDTIPIGLYLGSSGQTGGAHHKYRPNDLIPNKCRQLSMQHLKSSHAKRLAIYEHVCANLKPVFHNFLLEKFSVPGTWFERRLAYTNSVAVNSMVGYIVGLGDRHTQNILIDEKTAEVVHIDFGIAFEQGKIMPTPETVPFRLTRDMVAPMGITETNGVFKKSCETTMRVLRANPDIIMTILEVLLYDPLYIWKVVPVQASDEAASTSSEGENLTARRALLCVQDKLEGKRAGVANTYNVDVQVQRLINDAISKHNLCLLYPGWDPYL